MPPAKALPRARVPRSRDVVLVPAPRKAFTAATADRHELYQIAVQSPEEDLELLERVYRRGNRRAPRHLREDFCGTALLCATWVAKGERRTAEGFDLDSEPIAWGKARNLAPLGPRASRVDLRLRDVRARGRRPADIRVAQNFSYSVFKVRRELVGYFRAAREDLADGGIFALDAYGGPDALEEMQDRRRLDEGFTYVWDQARYCPGSADYTCHIHFRFRDGTEMKRAFSYDWRFWSLAELRDALAEAGFSRVEGWFEQSDDESGEGNGVFVRDDRGETARGCGAWIAYLIARK